jgi:hypothetical protein
LLCHMWFLMLLVLHNMTHMLALLRFDWWCCDDLLHFVINWEWPIYVEDIAMEEQPDCHVSSNVSEDWRGSSQTQRYCCSVEGGVGRSKMRRPTVFLNTPRNWKQKYFCWCIVLFCVV